MPEIIKASEQKLGNIVIHRGMFTELLWFDY